MPHGATRVKSRFGQERDRIEKARVPAPARTNIAPRLEHGNEKYDEDWGTMNFECNKESNGGADVFLGTPKPLVIVTVVVVVIIMIIPFFVTNLAIAKSQSLLPLGHEGATC